MTGRVRIAPGRWYPGTLQDPRKAGGPSILQEAGDNGPGAIPGAFLFHDASAIAPQPSHQDYNRIKKRDCQKILHFQFH